MKQRQQILSTRLSKLIAENRPFFDGLVQDHARVKKQLAEKLPTPFTKLTVIELAKIEDRELRHQLEHLGGYLVALRRKVPYKVIRALLIHLGLDMSPIKQAEDCFYLYRLQAYYAGKGKQTILELKKLLPLYRADLLEWDDKDRLFGILRDIKSKVEIKHIKRFGSVLFGLDHNQMNAVMLGCYRKPQSVDQFDIPMFNNLKSHQ